jgi:hypothetical protein
MCEVHVNNSAVQNLSTDGLVDLVRAPKEIVRRNLILKVTHEDKETLHQSIDDQQGQVTDQFVSPAGIRNMVHRNGVLVLDQVVSTDGTVKQLVPAL